MPSGLKSKREKSGDIAVHESCGNVFADLRIPNPDLALAKAKLVQRIRRLIAVQRLDSEHAARLLGIKPTDIDPLIRGRVEKYPIERLFRFLTALGQRVEISVRSAAEDEARSVFVV